MINVDLLAAATAQSHSPRGFSCLCGKAVWTEHHQAVEVGRAVARAVGYAGVPKPREE